MIEEAVISWFPTYFNWKDFIVSVIVLMCSQWENFIIIAVSKVICMHLIAVYFYAFCCCVNEISVQVI